ncbi:MAG: hypothetical protein WD023_06475 [Ilumatobacteraceae bacterium]
MRRWPWLVAAAAPLVALLLWVLDGESGPQTLDLPRGVEVSSAAVMTIVASLTTASLVACAWNARIGLIALAVVMGGTALFWPAVQDNRYSGDIVISFGNRHGIHMNDWYALGPAAIGALALVVAWKLEPDEPDEPDEPANADDAR